MKSDRFSILLRDYPDVLSTGDIMNILHIGKNSMYELIDDLDGVVRIGRVYKVPKSSLAEYLDSKAVHIAKGQR